MRFKMMGLSLVATFAVSDAAPAAGNATRAVAVSTSRPLCTMHGYHLDGNNRIGFLHMRRKHRSTVFMRPRCQGGYQPRKAPRRRRARRHRLVCAPIPYHPAAQPTTPSQPPPQPPAPTPLTVSNLCGFNPGLGVLHSAANLVYWDNNQDDIPDFGASNIEGDSSVDIAWVWNGSKVTWMAFCNPHETNWINVPRYEEEERQRLTLTADAWKQLSSLVAGNNFNEPWGNPEPSIGSILLNTGQCPAYMQYCERIY
jgi:hypothetical protein